MFYSGIQQSYKIERKDLISFKNYILIFAVTRINVFFENIWTQIFGLLLGSLLNIIIEYGGLILFAYGLYMLTKNNSELPSANKIIFWFIVAIIIALSRILLNFLFIDLTSTSQSIDMLNIYAISSTSSTGIIYLIVFYVQLFYILVIGIIIYLVSKYITEWFNDIFGRYNPTKAYYYFGVTFCLGSIVAFFGILEFNLTQNNRVYQLPGIFMTAGGIYAILISIFIEIVAVFKFYNRVNDMAIGKIPFHMMYPYQNPYLPPFQNVYQPSYQNPYQNPYQAPNQNNNQNAPFQNSNPNVGINQNENTNVNNKSFKFCSNCGIKLDRGDNFCKNCGFRF